MLEQKLTTTTQPTVKSKHQQVLEIVDEVITTAKQMGIIHLYTEDESYDGRHMVAKGQTLLNFSSCSYLGLELDPRLKAASIDAVNRYGTQLSSSRAYVSCGLYTELESKLEQIFGNPINLAHTTTLGHQANIPALVGDGDAIIMDSQVHECVSVAVNFAKLRNIHVDVLRHNRMDVLEDRIKELSVKYDKVWYMADGVYSMYGDLTPTDNLKYLLDTYEQFHLYVDDAHGMSWDGPNGSGFFNGQITKHPRVFLTTSLAKAFGSCGGVLVYNDERTRDLVRHTGGTFIFSGPIQPAVLGASIASANIHLSPEITERQTALKAKINYFKNRALELGLPLISDGSSPIFFVGVGKPMVGYNMVKRLMNLGFFINLSVFPSVSYNKTGLRMPITLHHTNEDIDRLLTTTAEQLPLALRDHESSMQDIYKAFRLNK